MSVALRYLTLQEVSGMTEKLAGMCRQLKVFRPLISIALLMLALCRC